MRSAVMVADGLRSGAQQQSQFAVFADGATSSTSANAFSVFEVHHCSDICYRLPKILFVVEGHTSVLN